VTPAVPSGHRPRQLGVATPQQCRGVESTKSRHGRVAVGRVNAGASDGWKPILATLEALDFDWANDLYKWPEPINSSTWKVIAPAATDASAVSVRTTSL
jgi:hypothetical protein